MVKSFSGMMPKEPVSNSKATIKRDTMAMPTPAATNFLIASGLASDSSGLILRPCRRNARSTTARVPEPSSRRINGSRQISRTVTFFFFNSGWPAGAMATSSSLKNTVDSSSSDSSSPSVRPSSIVPSSNER